MKRKRKNKYKSFLSPTWVSFLNIFDLLERGAILDATLKKGGTLVVTFGYHNKRSMYGNYRGPLLERPLPIFPNHNCEHIKF